MFPVRVVLGLLVALTTRPTAAQSTGYQITPARSPVPVPLRQLEAAPPARRVVLLLNHFDPTQAIAQHEAFALRELARVDSLGQDLRDEQLRRYARFLRDTFVKNKTTSHAQNAALFLAVGEEAEQADDPQLAAVCRHYAGQYYFFNEDYGRAFEHLLAANAAFQELGYATVPGIRHYLYELAVDFFHFQEYDKAVGLLNEAARHPVFNENEDIQTFNTLGMAHTQRHSLGRADAARQAEQSYRMARQRAAFHRDTLWIGIAAGNLARLYATQRQWAKALPEYRASYRIGLQHGENRSLPADPALALAKTFVNLGQLDSARHYLDQALRFFRHGVRVKDETEQANDYFRRDYADVARQYHRALGDVPTAYRFLDSLNALNVRITKRYNARQVSLVNQKLLVQQHQSEVARLVAAQRVQQTRTAVVGVLLGLVALLALQFFRLYRSGQARRRQEGLLNAEREKSLRLEKQLVQDELARAQADLGLFMDNLRQKNALIDAISAELDGLAQSRPANGPVPHLREAQQSLEVSSLLTNDDWDEFRRRFERVHPGFFASLKSQFTDLSPAEERLLSLAKLRVNTRQMSRMLGISPASVRTTRYRLRKKLGIDGHSSLAELLGEPAEDGVVD